MKILLCCNAGMSSSILVKKIRDVAEKTGEDIEVSAVANASIKNEVGKWDVCLVGPQLVFAVDSIHQQLNIPVASIEPRVYAMADGAAAIEMAKNYWGNMANVEQISQVAMQVITYAGMAKSSYLEALKYYRENDQTAYEQSMSNGDESFSQAHEAHLQLLQQEMNTQEPQITMLMAHAEDQLMSAETIKTLIQEIILLIESRGK